MVGSTKTLITQLRDFRMEPPLRGSLQPQQFLLFLGIMLYMALQPIRGGIDAYWAVDNGTKETVYTRATTTTNLRCLNIDVKVFEDI